AEDAHSQSGPGERMAEHHLARQAKRKAELAHLVLEQLAQWFQQLEMQRVGQTTDVVVRLDGLGFLSLRARRLDDVRVDRALRKPLGVAHLAGFALENIDEMSSDDLALLLGVEIGR